MRIQRRIAAYSYRRNRIDKRIRLLGACRLVAFVILLLGFSLLFGSSTQLLGAFAALGATLSFLFLMVAHDRCFRFRSKCDLMIQLLENDQARCDFRFNDIKDPDPIVFEADHPFAHDLDLTGPLSLLKLVDDSFHLETKVRLKAWIDHADGPEEIRARQQAVAELSQRKRFRLKLGLTARLDSLKDLRAESLQGWLKQPLPWTLKPAAYVVGRLCALATTIVLGLHFLAGIPMPWIPVLLVQTAIFYSFDAVHRNYCFAFMERGKQLEATFASIALIEKLKPQSQRLKELQSQLHDQGQTAAEGLTQLHALHEMLQYRANGLAHFLLNVLFLWDQHYLRKLEQWRVQHGAALPQFVATVFEVEALSALANFRWLFPGRPFPQLLDAANIEIQAIALGHPAIAPEKRVSNDWEMQQDGMLQLITGSNMSGKSTFLRTIGVNLILARMGAPVCAQSMSCSLPRVWTSIRIQDSLAAGVSYFYAEVQRIKMILDEISTDQVPVFYLMDEILKGTNSRERLIACKALAKFLIAHRSSGLITTHDLELLELASHHPDHISNYHFQEQIRDDEMFFDYQLKPGRLTSTNALRVMRFAKVPLVFEEDV